MRRLLALLTVLIVAGSLSSPAMATPTYTVTPGGSFSGTPTSMSVFKDVSAGLTIGCTGSSVTGTTPSGTGLPGAGLMTVGTATYAGCSSPWSVAASCLPFTANATAYAGGITDLTVGACFTVTGAPCSFKITGNLPGTYVNPATTLKLDGNAVITGVTNCLGLINNGDQAHVTLTYQLSPGQTITSP